MIKPIGCILIGMSLAPSVRAAEVSDEIARVRGGVANFCRELVDSLAQDRVAMRRKILFFGHHFFYDHGLFLSSPHLIVRPAEAGEKKGSFPLVLCGYASRELVPGSLVHRQTSTVASPSWKGAFLIRRRGVLLRTSGGYPPDTQLVALDFSLHDSGLPATTVIAGMEGMIRQIRETYRLADIVFVYAPNRPFLEEYRAGREPESIRIHEKVAEHHNIASVNIARFVANKIISGEVREEEVFLSDHVVSDAGDRLCLEAMKPLFEAGLAVARAEPEMTPAEVPQVLSAYPIVSPSIESYERAVYAEGWLDWQPSPIGQYLHVVHSETPGPVFTVRFKGNFLGLSCVVGPDSGDIEVSVDGSAWQRVPCFARNPGGRYRSVPILLAEGGDPSVEREARVRVAAAVPEGSEGRHVRISNLLVNGTIVHEDPYEGMTRLERIDAMYATLEPVTYEPPADRWKWIPKTMQRLEQGPSLTMVLLGDSIINDTSGSNFELLIDRMYPECSVRKVASVRSSTGCDWYKQENRVEEWVLRHNPDLLMIGGISNRGSDPKDAAESVREVVRQVREARPETEFLLMTGPFGWARDQDPTVAEDWQEVVTPEGTCYRSHLVRVAREEGAAFIDMNGIVGRYLLDSQFPYGSFQRDPIHANWRGRQVLGRILERFFAPKP